MHHELSAYIWILPIIGFKIYTISFADPKTVIAARSTCSLKNKQSVTDLKSVTV